MFGRTGTGKTTLVQSFLDELVERQEAVVLSGRCYERESVPYKALDSLIDALARYLKELPDHEPRLLPEDAAFLGRVFPVLESVEAIASGATRCTGAAQTSRSCGGDRSPVSASCSCGWASAPLILAIDDLQWGDVDSAILLSDLILSRRSPVLLFIGCFRSEDLAQSPFLNDPQVDRERPGNPQPSRVRRRSIDASRSPRAGRWRCSVATMRLALRRLTLWHGNPSGNPLFIDELVRHILSGEPTESWEDIGQLDLDEVLWERIQWQPEEARRSAWRRWRSPAGRSARPSRFKPPSWGWRAWRSPRCGPLA